MKTNMEVELYRAADRVKEMVDTAVETAKDLACPEKVLVGRAVTKIREVKEKEISDLIGDVRTGKLPVEDAILHLNLITGREKLMIIDLPSLGFPNAR